MIHFKILTIFPELFPGPLSVSVIGDALKNKLWSFEAINIRDYAKDKHKSVDDTPYGGGAGMVMKADVIASAIESHLETVANPRFLPFSNSTSPHKSRVQIFQKVDLRHGHLRYSVSYTTPLPKRPNLFHFHQFPQFYLQSIAIGI